MGAYIQEFQPTLIAASPNIDEVDTPDPSTLKVGRP